MPAGLRPRALGRRRLRRRYVVTNAKELGTSLGRVPQDAEEKFSESPGKENPSERSRRSRSPGSKPALANRRETSRDARSSGNGERV